MSVVLLCLGSIKNWGENVPIWTDTLDKKILKAQVCFHVCFSKLVHYHPAFTLSSRSSSSQPVILPAAQVPQLKTSFPKWHPDWGRLGERKRRSIKSELHEFGHLSEFIKCYTYEPCILLYADPIRIERIYVPVGTAHYLHT